MYTGVYWTELYTGLYTRHTLVYTGLGWTLAVHWIYTGVYTKLYTRCTLVYTGLSCTLDCILDIHWCILDWAGHWLYTGYTLEYILNCILDIHWCILDWAGHWTVHWLCPDVHLTMYQSVRCVPAMSSCAPDVSSYMPDVHSPIYQIVQLRPYTLAWICAALCSMLDTGLDTGLHLMMCTGPDWALDCMVDCILYYILDPTVPYGVQ